MFGLNKKNTCVLSHWYTLLDGFQYSTRDFYDEIERELVARQVPRLNVSRVEYHEGSVLSDKRVYLRLARERFAFDVCAAPFGRSYFFSLRLVEVPRSRLAPIIIALAAIVGVILALKSCFATPQYQGFGMPPQNQTSGLQIFLWIIGIAAVIFFFVRFTGRVTTPTTATSTPGAGSIAADSSGADVEPVEIALAKHGIEVESMESGPVRAEREVAAPAHATSSGQPDLGSFLLGLPVIGEWYEAIRKDTYYRHDTRLMYLTLVSEIVKKVEEISAAKGVKLLETHEHSPILADLYKPTTIALGK